MKCKIIPASGTHISIILICFHGEKSIGLKFNERGWQSTFFQLLEKSFYKDHSLFVKLKILLRIILWSFMERKLRQFKTARGKPEVDSSTEELKGEGP